MSGRVSERVRERGRLSLLVLHVALLGALLSACTTPSDGTPTTRPPTADDAIVGAPALHELPLGEWALVPLSGATRCADGSDYALQVRRGAGAELLVFFQGGGATWGELDAASGLLRPLLGELYQERVKPLAPRGLAAPPPGEPVSEATQVVVSYCSGDVHWGDADGVDALGEAIEQRGAHNARGALAWLAAQQLSPSRLSVVGCSAGAYGALLWALGLAELYPGAPRSLLLDAGLGLVKSPFLEGQHGLAAWNPRGAYADNGLESLLETLDVDYYERLLAAVAERFGGPVGVASTDRDPVQAAFWYLTGDDPTLAGFGLAEVSVWSRAALARLELLAELPEVSTFVSAWVPSDAPVSAPALATGHCLLSDPDLWGSPVGDAFGVWWSELRAGSLPIAVDLRSR